MCKALTEGKAAFIYSEKLKFIRLKHKQFKRCKSRVIRKKDIKKLCEFRKGEDYFHLERYRKGL